MVYDSFIPYISLLGNIIVSFNVMFSCIDYEKKSGDKNKLYTKFVQKVGIIPCLVSKQSILGSIQWCYTKLNDEVAEELHERWTEAVEEKLAEVHFIRSGWEWVVGLGCFKEDNVELPNELWNTIFMQLL